MKVVGEGFYFGISDKVVNTKEGNKFDVHNLNLCDDKGDKIEMLRDEKFNPDIPVMSHVRWVGEMFQRGFNTRCKVLDVQLIK